MNLIEEATKRLQQLGQAGVAIPPVAAPAPEERREPALAAVKPEPGRAPTLGAPQAAGAGARFRDIDLALLRGRGFITPGMADSRLLHELRIIKRPLIENALGRSAGPAANRNLIMVTSSFAGEGKTFTSLNLAMSIAMEVDCRVLLVDGDVVKPGLPQMLGIERAKGLMDVLTTPGLGVGDVLLKTNVASLDLLLAGTPQGRASELLASEGLRVLLQEISGRYEDRIVIFDSPPLLATTESRVLATHMGQVVVVVEAEATTHGALESALSTLESCPIVLTILNKASQPESASYYGYYGYGQ